MSSAFVFEGLKAHCELVQVDLAELARGMPRQSRLVNRLSQVQEEEPMSDPALLLVAVCALHPMRAEEIVESYRLTDAQCLEPPGSRTARSCAT